MQNLMLIPNLRLKFKINEILVEKNLIYCRMLEGGLFQLPTPSYLVTWLESLKHIQWCAKLLPQFEIHKKSCLKSNID